MVHRCKTLSGETVNDLLKEYPIPYSHIKAHKALLTPESKAVIAASDTLDTIIWFVTFISLKVVLGINCNLMFDD